MSDWSRRVGASRIAALALMYTVGHSSVAAAAPEPVRALVWRCLPEIGSTSGTESAFGEMPAKRGTTLWFAYATRSAADNNDKSGVVAATQRVSICWIKPGQLPVCPADDCLDGSQPEEKCAWLVYHKADGQGFPVAFGAAPNPIADFGATPFAPSAGFPIGPPPGTLLDWDDEANAGKFLYVRINDEVPYPALSGGGWCPVAQRLPTQASSFLFFGTPSDVPSFDPALFPDPCGSGNKVGLPDPANPPSACVAHAGTEPAFLNVQLGKIEDWQDNVAMHAVPAGHRPSPASECPSPECQCSGSACPVQTRVRIFSSDGGAHAALGHIEIPTGEILPQGPIPELSSQAIEALRIVAHEYWHSLEGAWLVRKNDNDPGLFATAPFHEGSAAAVDSNLCLFNYPGLDPAQCASPGKLGVRYGIRTISPTYFDSPSQSSFWQEPYVGGIFLRYAVEQYAVPKSLDTPAHPDCATCTDSSFPSTADPLGVPTPSRPMGRRSDEGLDLLGRLLDAFDGLPPKEWEPTADAVLKTHLGRGLEAMVLDMHTAMVLKDYRDTDARWRFEWVGDYNAGGPSLVGSPPATCSNTLLDAGEVRIDCGGLCAGCPPLDATKAAKASGNFVGMYDVPGSLYGVAANADGLQRVRRAQDSYLPSNALTGVPVVLPAGGFVADPGLAQYVDAWGVAYLSVLPATDFFDPLRMHLTKVTGHPHVRVFKISEQGVPSLVTACKNDLDGAGPDKNEECLKVDPAGDFDVSITVASAVPNAPHTKEVLVVVSAGQQDASFRWSIGKVAPHVVLLDPTTSKPVFVGKPASAAGRQAFLVKFQLLDENNQPLDAPPEQVSFRVPDCANAPDCTIHAFLDANFPTAVEAFDKLSAGQYWAVLELPASFYPALQPALDLEVVVDIGDAEMSSGVQQNALQIRANPPAVGLQLVLEASEHMNELGGAKLEALKHAGTLVIETLDDSDYFGLVLFDQDADSGVPLQLLDTPEKRADAIEILLGTDGLGCTSIGDGMLEAQSNFIEMFGNNGDKLPAPTGDGIPDAVQAMVVLSDGKNDSDWGPEYYYAPGADPSSDGVASPCNAPGCGNGVCSNETCASCPADCGACDLWQPFPLRLPNRRTANLPNPTVSAIVVGQDADWGEMQKVAEVGRGLFVAVDNPAPVDDLTMRMSDALLQATKATNGLERVLAEQVPSVNPADLPDLIVAPGTTELVVSIVSASQSTISLQLVSPSSALKEPGQARLDATVFRVVDPEPGVWTWTWIHVPGTPALPPAAPGQPPIVFVEQAVRSPLELFANVDVETATSDPDQAIVENGHWTGAPVHLRAIPVEQGAIAGCTVHAQILTPAHVEVVVALDDAGEPFVDAGAGDGSYGAVFRDTLVPGGYLVRFVATGVSAITGAPFRRERHLAFEVHDAPDGDRDGLPDWWERENGTDLARSDATVDADGDGLTNEAEWQLHTRPLASDTDGGGESDASEIAAGRNPRDRADDAVAMPILRGAAGNGSVRLAASVAPAQDRQLEVQQGSSRAATDYTRVSLGPVPQSALVLTATNDQTACYRARLVTAGATSAWSPPLCVLPRLDAFAPVATATVSGLDTWPSTHSLSVAVQVTDLPSARHIEPFLVDPASVSTGVEEMMVSTRSDFDDASWEPYRSSVELEIPELDLAAVYVRVRDGFGNESATAIAHVQ